MVRYQISLDPEEADSLARLAASEYRDPRDQIRVILRQELERRGLLLSSSETDPINAKGQAAGEAQHG